MDRWTPQDLAEYKARRAGVRIEIANLAKPSKYRNKRTEVDGIVFDSKREATRYKDLKAMQHFGLITNLALQVNYPLVVNGIKIGSYRSDFDYTQEGQKVVEDCKGMRTPQYRIKKKLMLALHGIEIRET